jgi:hypothetical protein
MPRVFTLDYFAIVATSARDIAELPILDGQLAPRVGFQVVNGRPFQRFMMPTTVANTGLSGNAATHMRKYKSAAGDLNRATWLMSQHKQQTSTAVPGRVSVPFTTRSSISPQCDLYTNPVAMST